MTEGVLILALGHPYYGNYATQLCRSIKVTAPQMKVAVVCTSASMAHNPNHQFDHVIECPSEYFHTDGFEDFLKAKTFIYQLSPFDTTIFLDADTIWLPNKPISNLFNEFKDINFTISNRGREKLSDAKSGIIHWAEPTEIKSVYGNEGWLYNLASELIYFKKCKEMELFFELVQSIYVEPKIKYRKFGHGLPDELAFELAMIKTAVEPHVCPYIPIYWEQFERKTLPVHEMYDQYYAYSLGGNLNSKQTENIYNALADHYNKQFGVRGYFPAKNKREWLKERHSI